MSEPFIHETRNRWKPLLIGGLLGVALITAILVLLVVLAGYQYYQYRTDDQTLLESEAIQVLIVDPVLGSEAPLGIPITVNAEALGPQPFLSMELWVDGQLFEVYGDPSGGSTPLSSVFTWYPETPGAHSLVARAINTDARSTYSTSVVVLAMVNDGAVQPAADPEGGAGGDGQASEGGSAYVPPAPPSPNDSVSPGEAWSGSPGEWLTNLISDSAPGAPELIVSAGTCAAALSIHDLSDNEEGFVIYRQVTGSPVWEQVATLASSEDDWLTYTDVNVVGGLLYYVSAFNNQGESSSNLALVNVEPGDCASQIASPQMITLELASFTPKAGTAKNYCYRSFDGQSWGRWPQDGFLNSHNESILLSDPDGKPLFETFDLMLECWGWAGNELQYLGDAIFNDLNPREPGGRQVNTESLSVEILVNNYTELQIPIMIPYGGGISPGLDPTMDFGIDTLPQLDWNMPLAYPLITTSLTQCIYHAPDFNAKYCSPYLGFNAGHEEPNPQPYLVWDPTTGGTCGWSEHPDNTDGKLNADQCKTYEELLYLAGTAYGYVGFEIIEHNSLEFKTYEVSENDLMVLVIPPLACEGNRIFKVRTIYRTEGVNPVYRASPWSYPVSTPCTKPFILQEAVYTDFDVDISEVHTGLPHITPELTYDPAECYNRSEPGTSNCQLHDGYQLGPNGDNPQPYIVWEIDEDPVCDESGNCIDFDDWIQALIPVQIGFELIEQGEGGSRFYSVIDGLGFSAPHLTCTGHRLFKVRWFFKTETGEYIVSPWSSEVPVPCIVPGQITPLDYVNIKLPQYLAVNMPLIEAKITYDPDECMAHLPPFAQTAAGFALFCDLYGETYTGPNGNNPRPYLVWTPLNWCPSNYASGGAELSGCKSYSEWLDYDGTVSFQILETSDNSYTPYKTTMANLTTITIPPQVCNGDRTFNVSMSFYTSGGASQTSIASQWSNPVTIPCDG